jgi:hypothetical protein
MTRLRAQQDQLQAAKEYFASVPTEDALRALNEKFWRAEAASAARQPSASSHVLTRQDRQHGRQTRAAQQRDEAVDIRATVESYYEPGKRRSVALRKHLAKTVSGWTDLDQKSQTRKVENLRKYVSRAPARDLVKKDSLDN